MNKLLVAIGLSAVGHVIAFFHMNGQFKWEFMKSQWWIILAGLPISYLFYYSTRFSYTSISNLSCQVTGVCTKKAVGRR